MEQQQPMQDSMLIHVHGGSPIIFVDGSYYVFHRYFATLRWFSMRQFQNMSKEEQTEYIQQLHTNTEFIDVFFKHLTQDIKKWQKKWKVPHGNIIFGFDCTRGNIWRHAHHGSYKQTRVVSESFNGGIFPKFYEWFGIHKDAYGIECMEMDCLEADDVIFLGVQSIQRHQPNTSVIVITNDNDYLQMRSATVQLVNAQFHDIVERSSVGAPEHDLLAKILMGDHSDNIPPVAPKIGPVTARKLACQGKAFVEDWAQNKGCFERYKNNERLISFACIPSELVNAFQNKYKWVIV